MIPWSTSRPRAPDSAAQEGRKVRPKCPQCGGGLDRISRRWVDRLVSLAIPLRRYRCTSITCAWEGNLRNPRTVLPAKPAGRRRHHEPH